MITKEMRERDTTQLEHELTDRYKHLFDLRAQAVTEKLEDPSQLRKTRKEIARLKTLLNDRKRAESAKSGETEAPAETETKKPAKKAKSSEKKTGEKKSRKKATAKA